MSGDPFVKVLACGCSGCVWGSNRGCLERISGRGMVLFTPAPGTGGLLWMLMGWNAEMWVPISFLIWVSWPSKRETLCSFASHSLQRKLWCPSVSTKFARFWSSCLVTRSLSTFLEVLHAAPCSFFLLFLAWPEDRRHLHKQQHSSILSAAKFS